MPAAAACLAANRHEHGADHDQRADDGRASSVSPRTSASEHDRDERIHVLVRDDLRDRGVAEKPGVRREGDQRARRWRGIARLRATQPRRRPSARSPPRATSRGDHEHGAAAEHLVDRRDERVLRQRQPAGEERAHRPRHGRAEHEREPDRLRAAGDARGITISASPARPTIALSRVAVATRSRARVRQRITCSGTEPAIIAAMLESIRVSASVTTPTPRREQRDPEPGRCASSRQAPAAASAGARGSRPAARPASMKRSAGREERRHRPHRDLDREVRRAPDDVDDPEGRPESHPRAIASLTRDPPLSNATSTASREIPQRR